MPAGGLVVARADPGPGSEVGWGAEPGHVGAGLGDDDFGGGLLDPGDGHQAFNLWGERAHLLVYPRRELLDGGGQLVEARQVHAAQERVVLTKVAGQGLDQGGDLGSHPARGHIRHDLRVVLAFDERGQHRPPGDTQDVGGYRTDLNPGILELLLQPLGLPGTFNRQSSPVAGQVTQVPDRFGRDERRLQQPALTQLGKPGRVRDIRLSTGQALGVRRR
jgi:hypothetical protein